MPNVKNGYDLEERTAQFAENIVVLCKKTVQNSLILPIANQLLRSGTSVGANYAEATGASSRKDFKNKVFLCKKEAMETRYWLRILGKASPEIINECRQLWKEAQELTLIFAKIASSSK